MTDSIFIHDNKIMGATISTIRFRKQRKRQYKSFNKTVQGTSEMSQGDHETL